jgi:uncharacterized membrane protein YfcA
MVDRWEKRFENVRILGWIALAGLPCGLAAWLTSENMRTAFTIFALFLILPAFIYTYIVVIWHWKDRYRGKHSYLWGAIILIETSGWFKIVYLVRHIIPDMCKSGRYRLDT